MRGRFVPGMIALAACGESTPRFELRNEQIVADYSAVLAGAIATLEADAVDQYRNAGLWFPPVDAP